MPLGTVSQAHPVAAADTTVHSREDPARMRRTATPKHSEVLAVRPTVEMTSLAVVEGQVAPAPMAPRADPVLAAPEARPSSPALQSLMVPEGPVVDTVLERPQRHPAAAAMAQATS